MKKEFSIFIRPHPFFFIHQRRNALSIHSLRLVEVSL